MSKKKNAPKENTPKEESEEVDENIVDVLLDEDDSKPITITDDNGDSYTFDQVATVPLNDQLYALLTPKTKLEGVEEDEAFVFLADEEKNQLVPVKDEETQNKVFKEYYQMCKDEGIEVPEELLK